MNKIFLPAVAVIFISLNLNGQSAQVEDYINKYKDIAIVEMHRTGIPASIKLAQAILESQAGESQLSVESNNHFGIKCGGNWEGPAFSKKDDDFDSNGNLIHSCFRVFENPEESYIAHSAFLLDPAKEHRYGFLFKLHPHDYKSWAWGLKKSGYATNPHYASLLINIIEDYALHSLDYAAIENRTIAENTINNHGNRDVQIHVSNSNRVVTNNKTKLVFAMEGDDPGSISERYGIPIRKILKFNEGIVDPDQKLTRGEYVYLQKKKSRLISGKRNHLVQPGETMYSIAQRYGIRLEKLAIRNRLYPDEEPAPGETIVLKGLIKVKDRPRIRSYATKNGKPSEDQGQEHNSVEKQTTKEDASNQQIHVVETGDTLYYIAKEHRVSIQMLLKWNKLEDSAIRPGQEIIVNP